METEREALCEVEMLKELRIQLPEPQGTSAEPRCVDPSEGPQAEAWCSSEAASVLQAPLQPEQAPGDALDAAQLWRAVHVGDESIVKAFVSRRGIVIWTYGEPGT